MSGYRWLFNGLDTDASKRLELLKYQNGKLFY